MQQIHTNMNKMHYFVVLNNEHLALAFKQFVLWLKHMKVFS